MGTHPFSEHPGHLADQWLHLVHEHIPLRQLAPAQSHPRSTSNLEFRLQECGGLMIRLFAVY